MADADRAGRLCRGRHAASEDRLAGRLEFICGTATLFLAGEVRAPSPWMMGLPFGIGQCLVSIVLHRAGRDGR